MTPTNAEAKKMQRRSLLLWAVVLALGVASPVLAQVWPTDMDKVYKDESHCLTSADMRGERDNPISCFCRDAIVDARYVYVTYILPAKDRNLKGVFLRLATHIDVTCGPDYEGLEVAMQKDWKWNGPEVVRTYPPDDVIKRIKPESNTKLVERWVPFTVQLVYRNVQGQMTRTETYSSRELIPDFQPEGKHSN